MSMMREAIVSLATSCQRTAGDTHSLCMALAVLFSENRARLNSKLDVLLFENGLTFVINNASSFFKCVEPPWAKIFFPQVKTRNLTIFHISEYKISASRA